MYVLHCESWWLRLHLMYVGRVLLNDRSAGSSNLCRVNHALNVDRIRLNSDWCRMPLDLSRSCRRWLYHSNLRYTCNHQTHAIQINNILAAFDGSFQMQRTQCTQHTL